MAARASPMLADAKKTAGRSYGFYRNSINEIGKKPRVPVSGCPPGRVPIGNVPRKEKRMSLTGGDRLSARGERAGSRPGFCWACGREEGFWFSPFFLFVFFYSKAIFTSFQKYFESFGKNFLTQPHISIK